MRCCSFSADNKSSPVVKTWCPNAFAAGVSPGSPSLSPGKIPFQKNPSALGVHHFSPVLGFSRRATSDSVASVLLTPLLLLLLLRLLLLCFASTPADHFLLSATTATSSHSALSLSSSRCQSPQAGRLRTRRHTHNKHTDGKVGDFTVGGGGVGVKM